MVKKVLDKEDKVISKIDNKYELVGYLFRYRTKELLSVLIIILIGLLAWLYFSGTTPQDVKKIMPKKEIINAQ